LHREFAAEFDPPTRYGWYHVPAPRRASSNGASANGKVPAASKAVTKRPTKAVSKKTGKPYTKTRDKVPNRRPPTWVKPFLDGLAKGYTVGRAAKDAGISDRTAYQLRTRDDRLRVAWAEAANRGTDMIEQEAYRRGVDGVDRPVFQGGQEVGVVREYSDDLLKFILRARNPSRFRDNLKLEVSGPNDGPIETRQLIGGMDPAQLSPKARRAIADALVEQAAAEANAEDIADAEVVE
jgi:hypothetical protein